MNWKIRFLKWVRIPWRCFTRQVLGLNVSNRNALPRCSALEKQQNSKKAGETPTFHSRNPKAPGEMHFVLVRLFPQSPLAPQPLCWLMLESNPGMCSVDFQISSVSIISPCTNTKICCLAQIQQSKCSMPSNTSPWVKPAWTALWAQSLTLL